MGSFYRGGNPPAPCLKLVRIMLETWYVSRHIHVVSKNIPFRTKALLILLSGFFLVKNQHFGGKSSTFTQSKNCESCVKDFRVLFSVFVR